MFFYSAIGTVISTPDPDFNSSDHSVRERRDYLKNLGIKSEKFNSTLEDAYVFISDLAGSTIELGAIISSDANVDQYLEDFLSFLDIKLSSVSGEETTYFNLKNMLNSAQNHDQIDSLPSVMRKFGLSRLGVPYGRGIEFDEEMLTTATKEEIYKSTDTVFPNRDIIGELDRIYAATPVKAAVHGHPVHYLIRIDDKSTEKQLCKALCQALYMNNRIKNRRVCTFNVSGVKDEYGKKDYQCLYRSCCGGSVIIRFFPNDSVDDTDCASPEYDCLDSIFTVMRDFRNDVQTIFCFPPQNEKIMHILEEYLSEISFVRIQENSVSRDRALEYLRYMAAEHGIDIDRKICDILDEHDSFSSADLHKLFFSWYDTKLKNDIFPQYSKIKTCGKGIIEQAPKGSAYDELMKMPGISQAKEIINTALNYYKAQVVFGVEKSHKEAFSKHMIFTGNPGTAKTSVARLFTRILKENGIVTTGVFIEAGRGNIVGKYVGWTAKNVQNLFRKASGGVLFIDEAYSLLDGHSGSFGDEAINTIVQEMENHRDDVIVIFAGYTDNMQEFLGRNPGLKSRISYRVPFPDYNTSELCEIANVMAERMDLILIPETLQKLFRIFDKARTEEYYGNGRYVRNIIEKARMKQLVRLLNTAAENAGKDDLRVILPEDVDIPEDCGNPKRHIGF